MNKVQEHERPKIRWCSPEKPSADLRIANANRQRQQKKVSKRTSKQQPRDE